MSEQNNAPQNIEAANNPPVQQSPPLPPQPPQAAPPPPPGAMQEPPQPPVPPQYAPPQGAPQPPPFQQPQYSQPPVQPQGIPPQYQPHPGYVPPTTNIKKGSSKVLVAILIIFGVIVFAGAISAFAFRDQLMLRFKPEAYLANSVQKTFAQIEVTPSLLPELDKFSGQPLSHSINVNVGAINDPYMSMLRDASVSVKLLTDWENSNMLISAGLKSSIFNINDNELYISPNQIALNIPMLFAGYGFVSADTESFASKWNASDFAAMSYTYLPEELDIAAALQAFFVSMRELEESGTTAADEKLFEDITKSTSRLTEALAIKHEGKQSIGGVNYESFACVIPAKNVKDFIYDTYELFLDEYERQLSGLDFAYYEDMLTEMREPLEYIKEMELGGDLAMKLYVDNSGIIRIAELEEFEMTFQGYFGPVEVKFSGAIQLLGKKNISDDIRISYAVESEDENYFVDMSYTCTDNNGNIGIELKSEIETEYYGMTDSVATIIAFDWDKNSQQSDNMKLSLDVSYDGEHFGMSFAGNLVEADDYIELSGAKISFDGLEEYFEYYSDGFDIIEGLTFGYKLQPVSAGDVSIEGEQTTDLFSLTMLDFEKIFGALAML